LIDPLRSSLLVHPDWPAIPAKSIAELEQLGREAKDWSTSDERDSRRARVPGGGVLIETQNPDNGQLERTFEYAREGTLWTLYHHDELLQAAELWMTGDILLQDNFRACGLAFLSACGTGVGAIQSLEEGAGLPAALLAAGVSAVVSSAWPVDDVVAALFADLFYEELFGAPERGDLTRAVDRASRRLRDLTREQAASRVAALRDRTADLPAGFLLDVYLETLSAGPAMPFQHPFYSGAFFLSGAARLDFA